MLESLKRLVTPKEIAIEKNLAYGEAAKRFLGLLSEVANSSNSQYYESLTKRVERNGYGIGCVWVDNFIRQYNPQELDNNWQIYHTLRIFDSIMLTEMLQEGLESGSLSSEVFSEYYGQADKILRIELQKVSGERLSENESPDALYNMTFGSGQNELIVGDIIESRKTTFNSGNCLVHKNMSVDCWCGNLITQQEIQVRKKFI